MKTIKDKIQTKLIINKSKFITIVAPVSNLEDLNRIIFEVKKEYPKATHYCYAYILENQKKAIDDGEPGGTAGMPILNVLEKNDLINVLCVVIRYFGGIKLGAGGLVRAYSKSTTNALKSSILVNIDYGYKFILVFDYTDQKHNNLFFKNLKVINQDYKEKLEYEVLIYEKDIHLLDNFKGEIKKKERVLF